MKYTNLKLSYGGLFVITALNRTENNKKHRGLPYLKDNHNSWILTPNGNYLKENIDKSFSAHKFFIKNPSLSGRGSSLKKYEKKK